MSNKFELVSAEKIDFEDDFYILENAKFKSPSGDILPRFRLRHPGAATVLPITKDKKIVLVNQFRPGVEEYVLEIPAGRFDKVGEDSEKTAKRELLEETGYSCENLEFLGSYYMVPGYSEEEMFFYIATGCEKVQEFSPDGGEEEHMTTHVHTYDEVKTMLDNKQLKDMKTVYALTKFFSKNL